MNAVLPRSKQKKAKSAGKTASLPIRILKGTVLAGALMILLGLLIFVITYLFIPIPKPSEIALAQTTKVYYSDGKTVLGEFSAIKRTIIDTKTLPKYVGDAVIASEDRTFYENNGIDIKGIFRAALNNILGGKRQGASTLTQQYVENYYSGSRRGYIGKIRESILALKINSKVSKEKILDSYLNTIYFGRRAYGIEAAARAYFNVSASELTLPQAALLVAVIPAPSIWDPAVDMESAKFRWNRVLNRMVEEGTLDPKERETLVFPETVERVKSNAFAGPNGYLLEHVRKELHHRANISNRNLDTGGYKIVTTIDKEKQDAAIKAVDKLPSRRPEGLHVGIVTINTKNGAIEAEYGGADYLKIQRNAIIDDHVLPGSIFKVFGLAAGLENGETLNSVFSGRSPVTIDGYTLQNYGNRSYGNVPLLTAWVKSLNTPFVALNKKVGPEKTREVAIRAGIPENSPGFGDLSNVLGATAMKPIDIAKAYTSIVSGGMKFEPFIVDSAIDSKGNVVYKGEKKGERVFEEDLVNEIHYAGTKAVQGHGGAVARLGRPIAGKTGTAQDNKGALFSGWTPSLYTLVAMYQVGPNGENQSLTPFGGVREIVGENFPATIWANYMGSYLKGKPVEKFPSRGGKYYQKYNDRVRVYREREEASREEEDSVEEDTQESTVQTPAPAPAPAPPAPNNG